MKTLLLILITSLLTPPISQAFSPYEAYLMSGRETHVGLIAVIKDGQEKACQKTLLEALSETDNSLREAGITKAQAFTRNIEDQQFAVIYFTYAAGKSYLKAAQAFEKATESVDWNSVTVPHPRAKKYGCHWLQMEWINFVHGVDVDSDPTSTLMIATSVIPEKEMQYRTLHQTVWPGVVDQIIRGNIHNLNVFLVELDEELVEFLYLEYMGADEAADDVANKSDPINQRWWKLTDACQKPFSDVTEGNWTSMNPVK